MRININDSLNWEFKMPTVVDPTEDANAAERDMTMGLMTLIGAVHRQRFLGALSRIRPHAVF